MLKFRKIPEYLSISDETIWNMVKSTCDVACRVGLHCDITVNSRKFLSVWIENFPFGLLLHNTDAAIENLTNSNL